MSIYTSELKSKFGKLHVMEKPLDVGSLCLDFDIKLSEDIRCFEKIHIQHIIQSINRVVKKYFKLLDTETELDCYVLVKEKPYFDENKKLYSDGFHLQYPNLILDVKDRFLVYEESKKDIVENGYFDDLFKILLKYNLESETEIQYTITDDDEFVDPNGNTVSNEIQKKMLDQIIQEIFDSSVIKRNSWFAYGSGKKRPTGIFFYKVIHIFDSEMNEQDEIPSNVELAKILGIRQTKKSQTKSKFNLEKKYSSTIEKHLKQITKRVDVKNLFTKNTDADTEVKQVKTNVQNGMTESSDPVSMVKKLLKLISKKRAGPYNEWITVGWALYNVSPTLLPEFIQFSKQDNKKYQAGCCEKVWDECSKRMSEGGYTIASLYMWAKEDNLEEYIKLIRANVNKLLEEANTKTDYDIARIVKEMYKFEYKCTSIEKNTWWQFENHRWTRIDSAYTLGIKLSEDVAKEFAELSANYMRESITCHGNKSDMLVKKSTDINKLIIDLKKTNYKNTIIKECASLFYDAKFEERLDDNPYLIGFDNGIYDLRTGLFRTGCPDDYMSFSTGYDYVKYERNNPDILAIEKFISSIHPADDLRKYVMCFLASILEGGNTDQKMFFWTGSGSNGKGTLVELIDNTLGDYYGTLPVSLITIKRKSSSSATPEMADKKGKRVLVMQEPEHDDEINVGYIKELTGQDKIMARALYSKPIYYIPQFVPILPCNVLPKISSGAYDGGVKRRFRVVEFSQKFVDEPTKPNEHPKDPELRNKLKSWHKPFMWILLNIYYPLYKKYGIEKLEPESVKISTQKYEKDSNVFYEFKEEFICDDPTEKLGRDEIWRVFKEWHTNNYNDRKLPSSKELYKYFDDAGYERKGSRYLRIVFKERIDDNDD
jgi:P4 family phage/plasmid primase-like protien